ncbi:MAG: anthranilate phosphoribosyltransferase [Glaciihabitans sp.]|nr:anthranilate phosphoribosyltransferase [Glaciihabitans sp.]
MTNFLAWIGIAVAFLVGAIGWIFAGVANSRAKAANTAAGESNRIAKEAVEKADQANLIAKDANQLSEDANALVGRSVAAQTEDWHVDWRAEWNEAGSLVILKNRGRDAALDASATVSAKLPDKRVYAVEKWPDGVLPNTDVTLMVTDVLDARTRHEIRSAEIMDANHGSSVFVVPGSFLLVLKISVRWRTGEGFPRDQEIELHAT